jgi:hypothetical protein
LIYNTFVPGRGCNPQAEKEIGSIRDQIGDPGNPIGEGRREGWVFNQSEFSRFPSECRTPLVSYRPRGAHGCKEVLWSWECGFPCAPTFPPFLSVLQCYSAGILEIGGIYREGISLEPLPESLWVKWEIQGDANTCDCDCTADVRIAQTEAPGQQPYFGPHFVAGRDGAPSGGTRPH